MEDDVDSTGLVDTYDQKIFDLQEERCQCLWLRNSTFTNY